MFFTNNPLLSLFLNILIYLFGCAASSLLHRQIFSSCGKQGSSLVAVCGLLIAVASLLWSSDSRVCGLP